VFPGVLDSTGSQDDAGIVWSAELDRARRPGSLLAEESLGAVLVEPSGERLTVVG